jgi:branched-chain amino acid transport system substrate-binding protein
MAMYPQRQGQTATRDRGQRWGWWLRLMGPAVLLLAVLGSAGAAEPAPVLLGLDAELGHKTSTSGQAVRRGMEIAIAEINQAGGVLGGRPLVLVVRDKIGRAHV